MTEKRINPIAILQELVDSQTHSDISNLYTQEFNPNKNTVVSRLLHDPRYWDFYINLKEDPSKNIEQKTQITSGRLNEIFCRRLLQDIYKADSILSGKYPLELIQKTIYPNYKIVEQEKMFCLVTDKTTNQIAPSPDFAIARLNGQNLKYLSFCEVSINKTLNYLRPKYDRYEKMYKKIKNRPDLSPLLAGEAFCQFFLPEDLYEKAKLLSLKPRFSWLRTILKGRDEIAIITELPYKSGQIKDFIGKYINDKPLSQEKDFPEQKIFAS